VTVATKITKTNITNTNSPNKILRFFILNLQALLGARVYRGTTGTNIRLNP
jgi:hypothetical protein